MKNTIFTICAKNYLAQALCLRESTLKYNDVDFYIFLSDTKDNIEVPDLITLDESWIPDWRNMAFKYNVIEFSTSVKPFCIGKLFSMGYEKVIYIDPDIYVYDSLNCVFQELENKSVYLTPHRCQIINDYECLINEDVVSNVGIYNLGFIGMRNNKVGNQIVEWWKIRLHDRCYIDYQNGLFVDQKWMDFIPGFFPEETFISHHLGLNFATWNIQERAIRKNEDGKYVAYNLFNDKEEYPLVFIHYSGYKPTEPEYMDRRLKKSSIENYPYLKELIKGYYDAEINNKYDYYSTLKYGFNNFDNSDAIIQLNRDLYAGNLDEFQKKGNPFDSKGYFYNLLDKNNLISNKSRIRWKLPKAKGKIKKIMQFVLYFGGLKRYLQILSYSKNISQKSFHQFILEND